MKYRVLALAFSAAAFTMFVTGCGTMDEAKVRELARDEANKAIEMQYGSGPAKFEFGAAWEKQFSYAQGNKVGNMIFVAGQLSHDTAIDEKGMPKTDLMTGKSFADQYRVTLENMKKVLASYGATMDDVVFLQNFVAPISGDKKLKAGDYNPEAAKIITEYFPKGLQAMTFVEVVRLYGDQQLVESNAIAIVKPAAAAPAAAPAAK
jgi:enamine deaminase RidA (YjgF/YER057c/UK114 family)